MCNYQVHMSFKRYVYFNVTIIVYHGNDAYHNMNIVIQSVKLQKQCLLWKVLCK